jgi:hypothetical protein
VHSGLEEIAAEEIRTDFRGDIPGTRMKHRTSPLPSLEHDYAHAGIESVSFGPRREISLVVVPLIQRGMNLERGAAAEIRFGGIANLSQVEAFFADRPQKRSELADLRYADEPRSKPERLFFELIFERIDARLVIECRNVQVNDAASAT